MRVVELIEKKREGGELQPTEVRALFQSFLAGDVPEYQMSALLMAIYFRGMRRDELIAWTHEMIDSGASLNFDHLSLPTVDKHSTGGVGDKISLPLAPLLAACDLLVPMMSGRGLGHTGGTLDKLESIEGFKTAQPPEALEALLKGVGVGMIGQTESIAPVDRELYALRDVTGTVPSIPLIASSIMSKKIAEGTRNLILDVKVGRGAFMQTLDHGRALARACIDLGEGMGCQTRAILTQMDQPLGVMVGNALEVRESIEILRGGGPADSRALVLRLAEELLEMTGAPREIARERLDSGSALERFYKMVEAQGGSVAHVRDPDLLPSAPHRELLCAPRDGYVHQLDARVVGDVAVILGAGRRVKSDTVDPRVGVELVAKVGDQVSAGDPLLWIHHDERGLVEARERLLGAYQFESRPAAPLPLVYEVLTSGD